MYMWLLISNLKYLNELAITTWSCRYVVPTLNCLRKQWVLNGSCLQLGRINFFEWCDLVNNRLEVGTKSSIGITASLRILKSRHRRGLDFLISVSQPRQFNNYAQHWGKWIVGITVTYVMSNSVLNFLKCWFVTNQPWQPYCQCIF